MPNRYCYLLWSWFHTVNIGQQLGRLYYDSGERERGLRYLAERGMVARVVALQHRPRSTATSTKPPGEA